MTDNYQIDKNSKLFQKFLNLKNKNNESSLERQPQPEPAQPSKPSLKASLQKSYEEPQQLNRDAVPPETFGKLQLHVTISDIEQAASLSMMEEDPPKFEKESRRRDGATDYEERPKFKSHTSEVPKYQEPKGLEQEQYSSTKVFEPFKPERARERRTRDFSDRNKNKNEGRTERSFRNEPASQVQKPAAIEITLKNEENRREKENMMSLNEDEEITIRQENMFTLGSREGEFKKKYEKLHDKYEELKETVQKQRKQRQQEHNDKDAELEIIREKYFEVRSNEDTLTAELKRTKEKLQSENMVRTKFEEEVKELSFKIQELEDMLDGKEANLKKRLDEANHWKAQNEQYKGEFKILNAEIEKLQDRCQYLQSENKMVKKDIQNKESLIDELRKNISSLIEENSIAKDEIYKLTIKAYHYEQENQIMRGDLMRRDREQPHQMSVIQENFMRSIESLSPKRREGRPEKPDRVAERQERAERNEVAPGNARRRQFARERAVTSKPQRADRPIEREERRAPEQGEKRMQQANQRRTQPPVNAKHSRQAVARIQYLQSQLQKRKQQKAMNGKLRRQKIQMQRELQQLLTKLNE